MYQYFEEINVLSLRLGPKARSCSPAGGTGDNSAGPASAFAKHLAKNRDRNEVIS